MEAKAPRSPRIGRFVAIGDSQTEGLHDYFVEMFEYTPQSLDNPAARYELQR